MNIEALPFCLFLLALGVVTEIIVRLCPRPIWSYPFGELARRTPYAAALLIVAFTTWAPGGSPMELRLDLLMLCVGGHLFHQMVLSRLAFTRKRVFISRPDRPGKHATETKAHRR